VQKLPLVDRARAKFSNGEEVTAIGVARARISSVIPVGHDACHAGAARDKQSQRRTAMRVKILAVTASIASAVIVTAVLAQAPSRTGAQTTPRYLPEYTADGDLILPKNFHEWVYVGSPLTPNALNNGHAGFPEYHNVYIERGSYEIFKKTNAFPEGTILFKELQLTLPAENPDGSRTEPSGRGYFPARFNGADVTVKDSKRYAATGGWGYYNFNHHEPKAPTAKARPLEECAYCHIASAKKDDVWTQFYPLLDVQGMPDIK
jgi:Cytochrome P460